MWTDCGRVSRHRTVHQHTAEHTAVRVERAIGWHGGRRGRSATGARWRVVHAEERPLSRRHIGGQRLLKGCCCSCSHRAEGCWLPRVARQPRAHGETPRGAAPGEGRAVVRRGERSTLDARTWNSRSRCPHAQTKARCGKLAERPQSCRGACARQSIARSGAARK